MPDSSHYQRVTLRLSRSSGGFISEQVVVDCCNLCGALVGNRPAHDVFCFSDDGPDAANYGHQPASPPTESEGGAA